MRQSDVDISIRLSVAELPVMPQVLVRLVDESQAENFSMARLALLVGSDMGMTAKVLGALRHPLSQPEVYPVSLERSLLSMGADTARTIIINESVNQVFGTGTYAHHVNLTDVWKSSLTAAYAARMIAEKIGYPHGEESYIAGLLHDLGRLLPCAAHSDALAAADNTQRDAKLRDDARYSQAGAALVRSWNLDSFVADSILYHHEPASRLQRAHPLIRIVSAAYLLSRHGENSTVLEGAGYVSGIDPAELAGLRDRALEEMRTTAEALGVSLLSNSATTDALASPQDPIKTQLARHLGGLVLSGETGRSFARQSERHGLLETVSRAACILFDFEDTAILLLDQAGTVLNGVDCGVHRPRLTEFSIPVHDGGMIAGSVLQRRIAFIEGHDEPIGIPEEQLLRILGAEYIVSLPLFAGNRCVGVLVGGASSQKMAVLKDQQQLLHSFSTQAAIALDALSRKHDTVNQQISRVTDEYRELSRTVAHEVNNPLSIIKNYLSVLDRKLAQQEPIVAEISILNEEIDRVSTIINGMTAIHPVFRAGAAQVSAVVHDVVQLFMSTSYASPPIKIVAHADERANEVDCDANTLKQVLVNLIKNAVEAMPEGGKVDVRNNGYVNRDGTLYIELCIRDSGPGIPVELMSSLFSPVRSTKGEGHHGLGLSIVYSLVKKANGLITCRSNKEGTSFEILLPATQRNDAHPVSGLSARSSV